jgi:sec-independent protein translocase protein TatA
MDLITVGPLEIVIILLIAFLLLGPEKLPDIAAKAGKIYRNLTRSAEDMTRTIKEDIEAETREVKRDLKEKPADSDNPPDRKL